MNTPEAFDYGNRIGKEDQADLLVWTALGINNKDGDGETDRTVLFEQAVDKAFANHRIGTLARAAAKLQVIGDNDMRHIDVVAQDNLVPMHLQDVITNRVSELSVADQRTFYAIQRDEEQYLNKEQDAADLHKPFM